MSTKLFWIHTDRHCATRVDGHVERYEISLKPVPIIARDINEAARLYYLRPDTSAWDYVTKVEEDEVDTADRIHELEAEVEELDFSDDVVDVRALEVAERHFRVFGT